MFKQIKHEEKQVKTAFREAFEITLTYFIFAYGYLWISDWLIATYVTDPQMSATLQTIKNYCCWRYVPCRL